MTKVATKDFEAEILTGSARPLDADKHCVRFTVFGMSMLLSRSDLARLRNVVNEIGRLIDEVPE